MKRVVFKGRKRFKLYLVGMLVYLCVINACTNAQTEKLPKEKQKEQEAMAGNILIVYLTRTNNTKAVAEMIHSKVGGDVMALELVTPYPEDYTAHVAQVDAENERTYLPPLRTKIDSIGKYDYIFVGFPTWDMQVPPPVKSFLNSYDWTGKVILPFNTNAGYGLGSSRAQFEQYCSEGTLKEIFTATGGHERQGVFYVMEGNKAVEVNIQLDHWLDRTGILK